MTMIISMRQLEDAINRARKLSPPVDYVLSHDVAAMAEAYAVMIYAGLMELDMTAIPEDQRIAIVQYLVHESAAPATGGC